MTGRRFLVVPVVVFLYTWTLTTHGKYSASGDEPHYLIIAESLRADGDLDLANNYAQNDGRLFGHDNLERGLHAVPSRVGDVRSIHNIGLAVAVLPVYVAARQLADLPSPSLLTRLRMTRGLFAYSIVGLFLIAVTSAGLTLLARGLSAITTPRLAAGVAIALGISPPVVSHAFLVFPEAAALFVTCCVVCFCTKQEADGDRQALFWLLAALGLLPWTHHKYFLYVPGLLFVIALTRWDLIRRLSMTARGVSAALIAVPQICLLAWSWYEWGTPAGPLVTEGVPFSWSSLWKGLVGLTFDRQSGLLAYAPMFWILPACWWLARRTTGKYAVPFVLLYVPAAAFVIGWWAGFAPAARYIAPAVPLLAVPIAYALRYRSIRVAAAASLLLQVPINAVTWQRPRWLWPSPEGNLALEALGPPGRAYADFLPDIQTDGVTIAAVWPIAAVAALTVALLVAIRREPRDRLATEAIR